MKNVTASAPHNTLPHYTPRRYDKPYLLSLMITCSVTWNVRHVHELIMWYTYAYLWQYVAQTRSLTHPHSDGTLRAINNFKTKGHSDAMVNKDKTILPVFTGYQIFKFLCWQHYQREADTCFICLCIQNTCKIWLSLLFLLPLMFMSPKWGAVTPATMYCKATRLGGAQNVTATCPAQVNPVMEDEFLTLLSRCLSQIFRVAFAYRLLMAGATVVA